LWQHFCEACAAHSRSTLSGKLLSAAAGEFGRHDVCILWLYVERGCICVPGATAHHVDRLGTCIAGACGGLGTCRGWQPFACWHRRCMGGLGARLHCTAGRCLNCQCDRALAATPAYCAVLTASTLAADPARDWQPFACWHCRCRGVGFGPACVAGVWMDRALAAAPHSTCVLCCAHCKHARSRYCTGLAPGCLLAPSRECLHPAGFCLCRQRCARATGKPLSGRRQGLLVGRFQASRGFCQ
jgi:hypothetical protein